MLSPPQFTDYVINFTMSLLGIHHRFGEFKAVYVFITKIFQSIDLIHSDQCFVVSLIYEGTKMDRCLNYTQIFIAKDILLALQFMVTLTNETQTEK